MSLGENESEQDSGRAGAPRQHRWRRRFKIAGLVVLLGLVAMRVILVIALPAVLSRVASYYGLQLKYDRESLALLGGQAGLWGVKVYPKAGGEPLLTADYLHGEILPWKLLSGKLHVLRAEADGVDILVQRTADGHVPLLEKLASNPTTQPPSSGAAGSSIDFTSPLTIDALRLTSIRAHLIDQAVVPRLDAVVSMNLRVSDLGKSADVPATFQIDAWSDKALDLLRLEGSAKTSGKSLEASATLFMRGLHPEYSAGYLQPLGIKPSARSIDLKATATIHAGPAQGSSQALAGSCVIENVAMSADDQAFATIDSLRIDADAIDSWAAHFGKISMSGGRFSGSRDAHGAMHIAGFELIPETFSTPVTSSKSTRYGVTFGESQLQNLEATFHDDAVSPPGDLKLLVTDASIKPQSTGDALDVAASLSAPGIAQNIRLDGFAQVSGLAKSGTVNFRLSGITPTKLDPYLARFGVKSELKSGLLTGTLRVNASPDTHGQLVGNAKLQDIRFSDGETLLAGGAVAMDGISVAASAGPWRAKSIDLTGPSITASRELDGSIFACGFRFTRPPAVNDVSVTTTKPSAPSSGGGLPPIEVDQLTWKGIKFALNDRVNGSAISISDAGVEIKNLNLTGTNPANAEKAGSLRAWITSPQLAPSGLSVEGSFTPGRQSLAGNLKVRGEKLQTAALAPYLKPLGVEPFLNDGTLSLDMRIGLLGGDLGMMTASVDVNDFLLRDASNELIGADELRIDSISKRAGEFDIGQINLRHPRGRILREANGAIVAGGVRVQLPILLGALKSPAPSSQPTVITLQEVNIQNAQLQWIDQAVQPGVNTTAYLSADVKELTLGKHAPPATFGLEATCEGLVEEFKASGEVDLTPGRELVKLELAANGVHGAAMNGYLPLGISSTVSDGRFHASVLASSDTQREGGRSVYVDVANAEWRDGSSNVLATWKLARLAAPRIDFDGDLISIDEISLDGFQGDAAIGTQGDVRAFGFAVASPPPVSTTAPSVVPALSVANAVDTTRTASDITRPFPLIMLKKLDLDVEKLTLRDLRQSSPAPIELRDVHLRALSPIAQGGQFADAQPPAHLELSGAVEPLLKKFSLKVDLLPLASEASANFDLDISGIRGDSLPQLLPELADMVDGSGLQNGRFQATARLHARLNRRTPRDFDFSHGFDFDLAIKDVSFRAEDTGRTLIGADALRADGVHIAPDGGGVKIKSVELEKPAIYLARETDGLHALGLTWKLPAGGAPAPATEAVPAAYTPAPPAPTRDAEDFTIDRLTVTGADFRIEDHAVNPPLDVPINSVDVEVRDFSTAALRTGKQIRFSAIAASDKVPLPSHAKSGATSQPVESRELFSQIASSGAISLYPTLSGYAKMSVSGFELAALQGEAAALGMDLSGGIFDADINARFKDEGSLDLHSKFVMTDLRLTEPSNGPVQRYFKLSAPLDMVIGAVQDPDGGITIPLNIPIENGKVSTANLVGAGAGALGQILATAVLSQPAKVMEGVGDLINPLAGKENSEPVVMKISFPPAETALSSGDQQGLDVITRLLKKDKNATATIRGELGGMDRQIAHDRTNLSPEQCRALADEFRKRRSDLAAERATDAAAASAELASASSSADASVRRLAEIDRQMAQLDDATDHLYDMLRPGASHQDAQRTRAACLQIAGQRLHAVSEILNAGAPQASDRITRVPAAFNPADDDSGGSVTVTVIRKKRQK